MMDRRTIVTGSAPWAGLLLWGCGGSGGGGATAVAAPPASFDPGTAASDAVLVQSGDSIGAGYNAGGYAAIDHLGFGQGTSIHNDSVSGRLMADAYPNRASEIFIFYDAARTCVLLMEMGTNDLGAGATAAALYGNVTAPFVASARAAGFFVVLNTILPRTWAAANESQRQSYSGLVLPTRLARISSTTSRPIG